MARLLADENFPRSVVIALRSSGHDVVTVQGLRMCGQSDDFVLATATSDGRAVLTLNRRDYCRFHKQGRVHAGMILCKYDANSQALAQRIHSAIANRSVLTGLMIRIVRPNPSLLTPSP